MTRDKREVLHAFERCVYNVVFNNRDDHAKNFSFLMQKDGQWKLSPGYDLTFSEGPRGEHQMDVCGEASEPSRKHLLELAGKNEIAEELAIAVIKRIAKVSEGFADFARDLPIRDQTLRRISKMVAANRARLL
jgi:serine/threonine-protein kinase HipA